MKLQHEQIQYVEFISADLPRIQQFYTDAFDWTFTQYGPTYIGFEGKYIDGGFESGQPILGTVLVILYSEDLEKTKAKIVAAGGTIVQDIFDFPGGKRFQFADPDGNQLAVWSQ